MLRRLISGLSLWIAVSGIAWAQQEPAGATGTLKGFVMDLGSGSTLHGAVIEIQPGGATIQSDIDGLFSLDLPPGKYRILARKPGYINSTVENVQVKPGEETWQQVPITPESGVTHEVVEVVADAEKATVEALLSERKSLGTLTDSIGRQEMSLNAGTDGAGVMQRVTGVSIVEDKYVFVRGLGERYSATQLNGSEIPSTQPDKKVVAMDLFPASLLENIQTEKSYSPDQPGDFAGGIVKVNTLDFPQTATFKISYGDSFNTLTTFKPFKSYPGGRYDFWGYDDGTRSLPSDIPGEKLTRKTPFSDGYTAEQLQQFGRSFGDVWQFNENRKAVPGQKFNFIAGNTWGNLGMVLALTHGTDFQSRKERMVFYTLGADDKLSPFSSYQFASGRLNARTSATANFAYRLTNDHKIVFRNFYTHDGSDESRTFEGPNQDHGQVLRDYRLRFNEEGIYSGQIAGEHYLGVLGNSLIEWSLTRARSTNDEPDLRETLYEFNPSVGDFTLANVSQSGFREFMNLSEVLWQPDVNWTTFFNAGGLIGSLKFGASYRQRDRDFEARRFRFVPLNTSQIDLTQSPNVLFGSQNIGPNGFELREETRNTDAYSAKSINRAFYGMVDLTVGDWRFIGGARVENDTQRVSTFDPFNRDRITVSSELANRDLLPALNVVYRLGSSMNLRGSLSKTLNRPEFRELAPFDFTDVIGGRSVKGYADLKRATIRNYDLRWEWFPGPTDLISASFFYKRFQDPIERVVEATAQLRTSFRNAESAKNLGFELDFRRSLGFVFESLEDFSVGLNYSFVDSTVEVPQGGIIVLTSTSRPLEGQSKNVFNGIFEYVSPHTRTVARALLNFHGKRISDVGALGLPDILEDGFTSLDAAVSQPLGGGWGLKFAAQNLLNEPVRWLQGGLVQREYHTGRTFSLSVSYAIFGE
ncbi:MAG: TonB-dependent receptor [Acidobacteriota bacterium]